jgi:short-subunit dehydrogenase
LAAAVELSGARVVITGASRGIGEALAVGFAGAGATVALVARNAAVIDALAATLGGSSHPADLGDPIAVSSLIDRIEEEAGPIDVLVNNAGAQISGDFTTASAEDLRRAIEVNYLAPAELVRQAVPRMLNRGGGHIVNVTSFAATVPMPGLVAYSASKAALGQFTADSESTCGNCRSAPPSSNSGSFPPGEPETTGGPETTGTHRPAGRPDVSAEHVC